MRMAAEHLHNEELTEDKKQSSLELDHHSREKIVTDMDGNFFVEAGAGSGKTTMLVNRLVAMVEQGREIERICAITFTKAAAGEFYDRFQKLLAKRSMETGEEAHSDRPGSLPPATEESRKRCRYALQNIDLCFMGTIDSFCNMVLSEHPTEAGIVSGAEVISEQEIRQFYRQEYVRITKGVYGQDLRQQSVLFAGIQKNPADAFADMMLLLADHRNVTFQIPRDTASVLFASGQTSLDAHFRSAKSGLIKVLTEAVSQLERKEQWIIRRTITTAKGNWDDCFRNVLDQMHYLDVVSGRDDAFHLREKKEFSDLMAEMESLQYSVSIRFVQNCMEPMEKLRLERGLMTYFDYLYLLREMLRKDAAGDGALIRHIGARHSYFLIDEFQDTNPMQAEIFFYLGSDTPVENWRDCRLRDGALFIVGDPKQSIYRFRGADVDAFMQVRRIFESGSGEVLGLTRNFRSTPLLKQYFNNIFTPLFQAREGERGSCPYWQIPVEDAEEQDEAFGGVYSYDSVSCKPKYLAECPDYVDQNQIVSIIRELVGNEKYRIRGKEDTELRPIRYSDIMVITHNKRDLGPIMREMDRYGIPGRVEGKVDFENNKALRGLWKLYQAVTIGGSRQICEALTGEIIRLQEDLVTKYWYAGGKLQLQERDFLRTADPDHLRVAAELEHLYRISRKALYMSPAALFEYLSEEYRIFTEVDSDNMEVVYYALERMRSAQRNGEIVSLSDGAEFLRKRVLKKRPAGEDEEERCLRLRKEENCVHLANLHKVKGLEAPVVILAFWYKMSGSPAEIPKLRIERGETETRGYLFSVDSPERYGLFQNKKYIRTDEFAEEYDAEAEAIQAEVKRLIYVAATRARNALIISRSGWFDLRNKEHRPVPRWDVLLADPVCDPERFHLVCPEDLPRVSEETRKIRASELYEKARHEGVLRDRSAEQPGFSVHTPSSETEEKVPSRLEEDSDAYDRFSIEETENVTEEKVLVHHYPAVFGTMIHRMMELLVLSRGKMTDPERMLKGIFAAYATPEIAEYEADFLDAMRRALEQLQSGGYPQQNGVPTDILHTLYAADEVYCEVPFSYRIPGAESDELWYGIMDVVYRTGDTWHIVDYKTNADGGDLDTEYHAQMQAYSRSFATITGHVAEAHTYHIKV